MGSFAIPALPSFPTVRNLLNTSPPVVYPSAPAPERQRQTRSRSNSIQDTPTQKTRPRASTSASQIQAGPSGAFARPLFPPSPHDVQVPDEWTPIRRRHSIMDGLRLDGSRTTTSSPAQSLYERGRYAIPERPAHRRAQSVARLGTLSSPTPTNRLIEVSRDPRLNSSAISLPTLCESLDSDDGYPSESSHGHQDPDHALNMQSPIVRARERRLSRASTIDHTPFPSVDPFSPSPLSTSSNPDTFPEAFSLSDSIEERDLADRGFISLRTGRGVRPSGNCNDTGTECGGERRHTRSMSSVPPPMAMPQQRRPLPRPPAAPAPAHAGSSTASIHSDAGTASPKRKAHRPQRSYSAIDINVPQVRPRGILQRQGSVPALTNLSDVSVMATWSFPSDPKPDQPAAALPHHSHGVHADGHRHKQQQLQSNLPGAHSSTAASAASTVPLAAERLDSSSIAPQGSRRRSVDQPSDRLRERLKLLSSLDTSSPLISSSASADCHTPTPGNTMTQSSLFSTPRPLGRAKTAPTQGGHRYSQSSPQNALPLVPVSLSGPMDTRPLASVQPLLPPPRPPRRPTTTRLRQPNPLSMPVEPASGPSSSTCTSLLHPNANGQSIETSTSNFNRTNSFSADLGSSPGSMISDHLSAESESINIPSPSSSVLSLPTLHHRHARRQSQVQPPKPESQGIGLGFGFGFGFGLSSSKENDDTPQGKKGYAAYSAAEVSSVESDNILESLSIRLSRCFGSADSGDGSDSGHEHDVSMADHGHGDDDDELDVHEQYLSLDDI